MLSLHRFVISCSFLVANGLLLSGTIAQVSSGPPIAIQRSVLSWAEIERAFQGTFVLPMAQEGENRFGYSEAVHTQLNTGDLIVSGHTHFPNQALVRMPLQLDGSAATRIGPWVDYTQGLLPSGWNGGPAYLLGGNAGN